MNLRIATITVKPSDWAQALRIANSKGLSRAAYIRLLVSDAIKTEARAARQERRSALDES